MSESKEDNRLECIDCDKKIDPEDLSSDAMCPDCLHKQREIEKLYNINKEKAMGKKKDIDVSISLHAEDDGTYTRYDIELSDHVTGEFLYGAIKCGIQGDFKFNHWNEILGCIKCDSFRTRLKTQTKHLRDELNLAVTELSAALAEVGRLEDLLREK